MGQLDYIETVLAYLCLEAGESVIDVGCGPGTLAIPLARAGHRVWGLDFSVGMLSALRSGAGDAGSLITPVLASWDDDWSALGVPMVDVVVASRSVIHSDMDHIVGRMTSFAKRRAAVTIATLGMPREDERVLALFGRGLECNPDYAAFLDALDRRGLTPQLARITSRKRDTYTSLEEAVTANARAHGITAEADVQRLRCYLEEHLVSDPLSDRATGVAKDYERTVEWTFIGWDV